MTRGRLLPLLVTFLCVTGLATTGCATLPSSSSPQVIDTFSPGSPDLSVPTPVPDQ